MSLEGFSLLDPEVQKEPEIYYSQMRKNQPVYPTEVAGVPVWLVTSDALCREVLLDHATFSSEFSLNAKPSPEAAAQATILRDELGAYPRVNTLITADPPRHDRFRKLVASAFTPKAMMRWQESFVQLATTLTESLAGSSRVEFRSAFADAMGLRSVAMVLGVKDDRLDDFSRWSDATIVSLGTEVSDADYLDAQRSVIQFQHYFADIIALRREQPADDMVTRLVAARLPAAEAVGTDGDPLTDAEILDVLQALLVAGNHTTARAMAEMMRMLAENPQWWERACADPASRSRIVEEAVRLSTPAQGLWRRATRDTEIGGVAIPARGKIFVSFASANRDDEVYTDPNSFNPDRDAIASHLAFGRGIHACLGQNMARGEMRAALDVLCSKIASFEIALGHPLRYDPNFIARGLQSLTLDVTYR